MKRYSSNKDINKFINQLLKMGWTTKTGKTHSKLIAPNGCKIAIPSSPSDRNVLHVFTRSTTALLNQGFQHA